MLLASLRPFESPSVALWGGGLVNCSLLTDIHCTALNPSALVSACLKFDSTFQRYREIASCALRRKNQPLFRRRRSIPLRSR